MRIPRLASLVLSCLAVLCVTLVARADLPGDAKAAMDTAVADYNTCEAFDKLSLDSYTAALDYQSKVNTLYGKAANDCPKKINAADLKKCLEYLAAAIGNLTDAKEWYDDGHKNWLNGSFHCTSCTTAYQGSQWQTCIDESKETIYADEAANNQHGASLGYTSTAKANTKEAEKILNAGGYFIPGGGGE